jgi:hypothetical protein
MLDKNVYNRLFISQNDLNDTIEILSDPLYHETIILNRYLVHDVASGLFLPFLFKLSTIWMDAFEWRWPDR